MAMSTPRVATHYPLDSQPTSFENSVFQNCFFGVLTASGRISTTCRKKWGNSVLIDQNWKYCYLSNDGLKHDLNLI